VAHAQVPRDPYEKENAQIRILIQSGNAKVRNKDYDGAIADFTEAIKIGKDLPDMLRSGPYINRGMAYEKKGDLDAAVDDLNKAIKIQSNNVYAYHDRGEIYRKRNDLENAIADFNKAIKVNSKFAPAYRSRGLVLLSQGQDAEAQLDFDKFLELVPNAKDSLEHEIADIKAKRTSKP
jgi:tetratricopeptide (TPR) repeat protein